MKIRIFSLSLTIVFLIFVGCASPPRDQAPNVAEPDVKTDFKTHAAMETASLKELAEFKGVQVTGVTMTEDGRLFANFPRWRDGLPFSVVEIAKDGSYKPYPNDEWNAWRGTGTPAKNQFNTVQSVVAHNGLLYVVDPSSPMMKGVVGKPKLYVFDLAANTLKKTYEFTPLVAPKESYLNDLRVDDRNNAVYMTDSGLGAIVVLDLKSGHARRLLSLDKSTKSEDIKLSVEGKTLLIDGKPPKIHSDGIALSPDNTYLYYHALTGRTLYRISTTALNDKKLSTRQLAKQVEALGLTPSPDGMIFDQAGNLYMADLQSNSVVYRTPQGVVKTLVQDPRIKWADTFTLAPSGGGLIFTASRLHETPAGTPATDYVYKIFKTPLAPKAL